MTTSALPTPQPASPLQPLGEIKNLLPLADDASAGAACCGDGTCCIG